MTDTATTFAAGTELSLGWLRTDGQFRAYALGPVVDGYLYYVVVDTGDGQVTTYRANDQSMPEINANGTAWDMPSGMIRALLQSQIREFRNAEAENTRYRATVELQEQLDNARRNNSREAIMREMMERAAEIAESEGFCSEYDRLADALGYEGRERDWVVRVEIESFYVEVSTRATSADAACDSIEESDVDDAIRSFISNNSVSWTTESAERD